MERSGWLVAACITLALSVNAGAQSLPRAAAATHFFPKLRTAYALNLTDSGMDVVDRATGTHTIVPFGDVMSFLGLVKYSKPSIDIVHHVGAHCEAYSDWDDLVDLPVDFLRTGAYFLYGSGGWAGGAPLLAQQPVLPDRPDKVIVGYINAMEFSALGQWDPSFDPAWDRDGDGLIDAGAQDLPAYVDPAVFDQPWKNYVAAYWTEAWREQIARKIDILAAEHFDGVVFDQMGDYWRWLAVYPNLDERELREDTANLFRWASTYAKSTYGTSFVVSVNLDAGVNEYFPDLNQYIDAGYFQNAFFDWTGSGVVNGYGLSTSPTGFSNPALDFIRSQGLAVLDMDQLGTGPVTPGLDFVNYDDRITTPALEQLMLWAIQSGSTPYAAPLFFGTPFTMIPRFVRMLPDRPSTTNTPYPDWIIGTPGNDQISTGGSDDLIYGGAGDDVIDGGDGTNTAFYTGVAANFSITVAGDHFILTDRSGAEGTDTLINIQRLQFADRLVALDGLAR